MYFKTVKCLLKQDGRILTSKTILSVKKKDVLGALEGKIGKGQTIKFKLVPLQNQKRGMTAKLYLLRKEKHLTLILRTDFILIIDRNTYSKLIV